jgi:4'-phosphopantetheinyl transferase
MIRLRLFDEMSLCTDAEVERMLPLVPDSRREQALRFRHTFGRFACLKSYLMLEQLLRDEFGISNPRISVSEHGKPYLADYPNIHFNISHCLKAVAVVVADIPVGIDVESFRDYSDGLLDKTMNETERQEIAASDSPKELFASYWTRKEAVFKLHGTGITDDLHGILTTKETTDTMVNREKGYAVSVAVYSKDCGNQLAELW